MRDRLGGELRAVFRVGGVDHGSFASGDSGVIHPILLSWQDTFSGLRDDRWGYYGVHGWI